MSNTHTNTVYTFFETFQTTAAHSKHENKTQYTFRSGPSYDLTLQHYTALKSLSHSNSTRPLTH